MGHARQIELAVIQCGRVQKSKKLVANWWKESISMEPVKDATVPFSVSTISIPALSTLSLAAITGNASFLGAVKTIAKIKLPKIGKSMATDRTTDSPPEINYLPADGDTETNCRDSIWAVAPKYGQMRSDVLGFDPIGSAIGQSALSSPPALDLRPSVRLGDSQRG